MNHNSPGDKMQKQRQTILLVDDIPENIEVLDANLKNTYRIKVATSGEIAIKAASTAPVPDIILLDIMMPGIDGYEVCRRLKEDNATKSIPVIFITAIGQEQNEEVGFSVGAVDFIRKPINIPVATARIKAHLQLKLYQDSLEQLVMERTAVLEKEIIERKHAEEGLRLKNILFETQQEVSIDGILVVDGVGGIISFNRRFINMWGIPPETIEAKSDELALKSVLDKLVNPEQFLEGVRYLYEHHDEKSHDEIMLKDGKCFDRYSAPMTGPDGHKYGRVWNFRDITERKKAEATLLENEKYLENMYSEIQQLLNSITSIIIGVSTKDTITHWNKISESTFGLAVADVMNKKVVELGIDWDTERIFECISACILQDSSQRIEDVRFTRKDGMNRLLGIVINPIKGIDGNFKGFIIQGADITERRFMEAQFAQTKKMESIGQMSAGIAHEINSPMQYINDNLHFLKTSVLKVSEIIEKYNLLVEKNKSGDLDINLVENIAAIREINDEPYLLKEIPKAIDESIEGVGRVVKIITSMKDFSHPDMGNISLTDINKAIDSTVTVSRNEWKYVADIVFDLDKDLPSVPCFAGEFNQAILNIIVNAAQAIGEKNTGGSGEKGIITVKSKKNNPWAEIIISDNGGGIPKNVQPKIFDPFFTTKDVGKGTGQGLAIAHSVIVKKHGGELFFKTEETGGTSFYIRIPLEGS